jgi:hypothetical protein
MSTLTQAEFEVKYAAKRAMLVRVYGTEMAAAVEELGYRDADDLMDACATNEPDAPFKDGYCSDEAITYFVDSVIGAISN